MCKTRSGNDYVLHTLRVCKKLSGNDYVLHTLRVCESWSDEDCVFYGALFIEMSVDVCMERPG